MWHAYANVVIKTNWKYSYIAIIFNKIIFVVGNDDLYVKIAINKLKEKVVIFFTTSWNIQILFYYVKVCYKLFYYYYIIHAIYNYLLLYFIYEIKLLIIIIYILYQCYIIMQLFITTIIILYNLLHIRQVTGVFLRFTLLFKL